MIPFHETPATGPAAALAARMQAMVPTLRTARLILRAVRIEDFAAFAEIVLGPQGRFYGAPRTRDEAWGIFMQLSGTWYLRGHGAWTVTDRDAGTVLGFVHIGAEPGDMEPELGFVIAQAAEGRGLAFEAADAVKGHARDVLRLDRLVSYVDRANTRSARLAERLGARRCAVAEAALPEADQADTCVYRYDLTGDSA